MDLAVLGFARPVGVQLRGALAPICGLVSTRSIGFSSSCVKDSPRLSEHLPLADIAVPDVLRGHRDEGNPAEFEPFTRLALDDGSCTNTYVRSCRVVSTTSTEFVVVRNYPRSSRQLVVPLLCR